MKLSRKLPNIGGNIWWHGYWVTGNYKGAADSLAMKYQSTIALPPAYREPAIRPANLTDIRIEKEGDRKYLS